MISCFAIYWTKISQLWLKMSWKRKGTIQIKQKKKNRGKFEIKKNLIY